MYARTEKMGTRGERAPDRQTDKQNTHPRRLNQRRMSTELETWSQSSTPYSPSQLIDLQRNFVGDGSLIVQFALRLLKQKQYVKFKQVLAQFHGHYDVNQAVTDTYGSMVCCYPLNSAIFLYALIYTYIYHTL